MQLTLKNIKILKRKTDNELTKRVCDYVIDEWNDYNDKKHIFIDVLYHGCQSGIVGFLICYSDTTAFYKKYIEEINTLLYNVQSSTGLYSMKDLFDKKWDEEDPLAIEDYNQNLLAWFGFEETLRNIGLQFESLEDCI
jgi:hypothetical protein